jgi:hypothetical protein
MTTMIDAVRRVPRAFARLVAVAGLSLAAAAADAPAAAAQQGPQAIQQMFNDPALANYRLTTANLNKFLAATRALQAMENEDFDLDDQFKGQNPQNVSIARIAAAFEGEPRIKRAINGAGMTSRDYVTFLFSTMQAMFGSVMVQMGGDQALADMPAGVLKQNIQFFMAHQEAFEALDMGS